MSAGHDTASTPNNVQGTTRRLNFMRRLDGTTHPALDQTTKAPAIIQGVEPNSDKLIFIDRWKLAGDSEIAPALPNDAKNSTHDDEISVRDMCVHPICSRPMQYR